jgi:hypothetical protein
MIYPRCASIVRLQKLGPGTDSETDVSDAVYQAVMDCLLLKRDAHTPLECPDDKVRYPMEQMPGLEVKTEILGHRKPDIATSVAQIVTMLLRKQYSVKPQNDSVKAFTNHQSGKAMPSTSAAIQTRPRLTWRFIARFGS